MSITPQQAAMSLSYHPSFFTKPRNKQESRAPIFHLTFHFIFYVFISHHFRPVGTRGKRANDFSPTSAVYRGTGKCCVYVIFNMLKRSYVKLMIGLRSRIEHACAHERACKCACACVCVCVRVWTCVIMCEGLLPLHCKTPAHTAVRKCQG
jgi:hypothetical protein